MGVLGWIHVLDAVGALLSFALLFAALLLIGRNAAARARHSRDQALTDRTLAGVSSVVYSPDNRDTFFLNS